jgi:hypothetical protein
MMQTNTPTPLSTHLLETSKVQQNPTEKRLSTSHRTIKEVPFVLCEIVATWYTTT